MYVKDKKDVYYNGKRLPFADPTTFELINWSFAKDKKHEQAFLFSYFWEVF